MIIKVKEPLAWIDRVVFDSYLLIVASARATTKAQEKKSVRITKGNPLLKMGIKITP
jgi:hypothetical protein